MCAQRIVEKGTGKPNSILVREMVEEAPLGDFRPGHDLFDRGRVEALGEHRRLGDVHDPGLGVGLLCHLAPLRSTGPVVQFSEGGTAADFTPACTSF